MERLVLLSQLYCTWSFKTHYHVLDMVDARADVRVGMQSNIFPARQRKKALLRELRSTLKLIVFMCIM